MMISVENYYESELKGKGTDEIMTAIRSLKKKIAKLKRIVEDPLYSCESDPSESVQLHWSKKYLERAIQALSENGGTYTPTKAEMYAKDFDDNIENIQSIEFVIGAFDSYRPKREYHFVNGRVRCEEDYDGFSYETEKQTFIENFRRINIGEWEKRYTTEKYNIVILDGIQWELIINYSNLHKPTILSGDNVYPYNFRELLWLLDINPSILDDEECELDVNSY